MLKELAKAIKENNAPASVQGYANDYYTRQSMPLDKKDK